ncbi:hypothetical protein [Chitinivorax sp. B]|uniref:hypothetical protein n=1 Tax=Chitinivorax sp. B TaxID=2502235 RepID=UPI0010F66AB8|nr:hypothetical protein [Chitinivorax sp. B]
MSARKAALSLHALGAADRRWILAQLDDTERQQLEFHLDELQSLGIPANAELASAVIQSQASCPADQPAMSNAAMCIRHQLDNAPAADIVAVLREEPNWILAPVLKLGPWSWQPALLSALDANRRTALVSMLHTQPALQEGFILALLSALDSQLTMLPSQIDVAPSALTSTDQPPLLRWVRKWLP